MNVLVGIIAHIQMKRNGPAPLEHTATKLEPLHAKSVPQDISVLMQKVRQSAGLKTSLGDLMYWMWKEIKLWTGSCEWVVE